MSPKSMHLPNPHSVSTLVNIQEIYVVTTFAGIQVRVQGFEYPIRGTRWMIESYTEHVRRTNYLSTVAAMLFSPIYLVAIVCEIMTMNKRAWAIKSAVFQTWKELATRKSWRIVLRTRVSVTFPDRASFTILINEKNRWREYSEKVEFLNGLSASPIPELSVRRAE